MEMFAHHSDKQPVKLYWWASRPNFGDDLSRDVVAYVSGCDVVWTKPVRADLFAVGSIMSMARRGAKGRGSPHKPAIWGSGCMGPLPADFVEALQPPQTVRGPITASLLNLRGVNYGDPGILAANVHIREEPQQDIVGIVPHHTEVDDPAVQNLVESDPRFRLIETRRPAKVVCAEIAACSMIFSSSLHGLIVADSYGVANHWFVHKKIHTSPGLKFYDYATGIERALAPPLGLDDIAQKAKLEPPATLTYQDGIERSQSNLLESFSTNSQETELHHA